MHKTNNMIYFPYTDKEYHEKYVEVKTAAGCSERLARITTEGNVHTITLGIECESVEYRKLNDLVTVALLKNPIIQQKKYTTNKEVFDSIRRTGYRKRCQKVEVIRSTVDSREPIKFYLSMATVEEVKRHIESITINKQTT
jgi:hypothetical protein